MQPTIRYAKSDHVHVAYEVFGDGAVDLVFVPGFISHLENWWSEPGHARWLRRLGESARVILFDKRGTGLSDRVDQQPGMDARMDDVRAVMDPSAFGRLRGEIDQKALEPVYQTITRVKQELPRAVTLLGFCGALPPKRPS
jgi:hypothetical protein